MSERGSASEENTGDSEEEQTVKHEMRLTLLPFEPPAGGNGEPATSDTGAPRWPSAMLVPPATPQRKGREQKTRASQRAAENRDPLLTVGEFADELRLTRACVRKWILTRRVGVVKIGRLVRLRSSELRRIVEEGSQPRAEPI